MCEDRLGHLDCCSPHVILLHATFAYTSCFLTLKPSVKLLDPTEASCEPTSKTVVTTSTRQWKHWAHCLRNEVLQQPRTVECFEKIALDPAIDFSLPPRNSLPGAVLKHVFQTVDAICEREWPLIYKVGYTHDAVWRFRNSLYGYSHDRFHQWDRMRVLYAAPETISPAYVEAALIQRHKGCLDQITGAFVCVIA